VVCVCVRVVEGGGGVGGVGGIVIIVLKCEKFSFLWEIGGSKKETFKFRFKTDLIFQ
jgi:hypothetical protein